MSDKRALTYLEPLASHRRGTAVAEALADMIDKAGLRVGDKLPPEVALADHLGVGRSTIRETLKRWEALGLIRRRRGDGTYLAAPVRTGAGPWPVTVLLDGAALLRVLDVQRTLEIETARQAADRATPAQRSQIATLGQGLVSAIMAGRPDPATDRAYREAVHAASDNPVFGQMLQFLDGMLAGADGAPFVRGRFSPAGAGLLQGLTDALIAGHGAAAALAVTALADLVEDDIRATTGLPARPGR